MTRRGFTLIELLIAVSLATIVMIGVMQVSTMMLRQHLQTIHRGEVAGTTLVALDVLKKDLETSDVIFFQNGAGTFSERTAPGMADIVGACKNWSNFRNGAATGAKLDPNEPVSYVIYCVAGLNAGGQFGTLYRYTSPGYGSSAPTDMGSCSPPPFISANTCPNNTNANYTAQAWVQGNGTSFGISRADPGQADACWNGTTHFFFCRSRDTNGLEMHYIVGNATVTVQTAGHIGNLAPQYFKIDTKIGTVKSFEEGPVGGTD